MSNGDTYDPIAEKISEVQLSKTLLDMIEAWHKYRDCVEGGSEEMLCWLKAFVGIQYAIPPQPPGIDEIPEEVARYKILKHMHSLVSELENDLEVEMDSLRASIEKPVLNRLEKY